MKNIFELLREKELKKTPLRIALLQIFSAEKSPFSVAEIEKKLAKKKLFPNKTSLYRQMETLEEKNILSKTIFTNGVAHYEMHADHHHHFQCDGCQKIECIHDRDIEDAIHALEHELQKKGLSHLSHHFSLSGMCKNCQ